MRKRFSKTRYACAHRNYGIKRHGEGEEKDEQIVDSPQNGNARKILGNFCKRKRLENRAVGKGRIKNRKEKKDGAAAEKIAKGGFPSKSFFVFEFSDERKQERAVEKPT